MDEEWEIGIQEVQARELPIITVPDELDESLIENQTEDDYEEQGALAGFELGAKKASDEYDEGEPDE